MAYAIHDISGIWDALGVADKGAVQVQRRGQRTLRLQLAPSYHRRGGHFRRRVRRENAVQQVLLHLPERISQRAGTGAQGRRRHDLQSGRLLLRPHPCARGLDDRRLDGYPRCQLLRAPDYRVFRRPCRRVGCPAANGTHLKYTLRGVIAAVGSNTADVKLRYRVKGSANWDEVALLTGVTAIDLNGVTLVSPSFSTDSGYELVLEIADRMSAVASATRELPSAATRLLYFDKVNRRIGVGVKNDTDLSMRVGMDAAFTEEVHFEKAPSINENALSDFIEMLREGGMQSRKLVYDVTLAASVATGSNVFAYEVPAGEGGEDSTYEFELWWKNGLHQWKRRPNVDQRRCDVEPLSECDERGRHRLYILPDRGIQRVVGVSPGLHARAPSPSLRGWSPSSGWDAEP